MKINDWLALALDFLLGFCLIWAASCDCSRSFGIVSWMTESAGRNHRCPRAARSSISVLWAKNSALTQSHRWRPSIWKICSGNRIAPCCCFWSYYWFWADPHRRRCCEGGLFSPRSSQMSWSWWRWGALTQLFSATLALWIIPWLTGWVYPWGSFRKSTSSAFRCHGWGQTPPSTVTGIFSARQSLPEGEGWSLCWRNQG